MMEGWALKAKADNVDRCLKRVNQKIDDDEDAAKAIDEYEQALKTYNQAVHEFEKKLAGKQMMGLPKIADIKVNINKALEEIPILREENDKFLRGELNDTNNASSV